MRKLLGYIVLLLAISSCAHDFNHSKFVTNNSTDTLTIINPDFDTIIYALPGETVMVYEFKVLDTKQEMEDCRWLGEFLFITNEDDSSCTKSVFIEENWSSIVGGEEKKRYQECTFEVDDLDFF